MAKPRDWNGQFWWKQNNRTWLGKLKSLTPLIEHCMKHVTVCQECEETTSVPVRCTRNSMLLVMSHKAEQKDFQKPVPSIT